MASLALAPQLCLATLRPSHPLPTHVLRFEGWKENSTLAGEMNGNRRAAGVRGGCPATPASSTRVPPSVLNRRDGER